MKRTIALFMALIVSLSLIIPTTYAKDEEKPFVLRQPKLSAEYTGLQVSLSISPNGNSAGHWYMIERSSKPDMSADYKLVQDWDLSLVAADTVEPDSVYYYRTKLKTSKNEESPWSDVISIHTVVSTEPKKDPSQKTPKELLLDKIADMSIAQKAEYMDQIFNFMPYTVEPERLGEHLKRAIRNSTIPNLEKDVFLLEPYLLERLGTPDYLLFDTKPLGKDPVFKDLPENHWAYKDARNLYYAHIVSGFEDGTYRPNDTVTLAQALVFLDRTVKNHSYTTFNWPRTEVEKALPPTDYWAYYHIASISTKLDHKTLPLIQASDFNKPISREMLAQLIYSVTNGKLNSVTTSGNYRDIDSSSYPQALRYCLRAGLFQGSTSQYIRPKDSLTRGELTVILSRLNEMLLQETERLEALEQKNK